MPALRLPVFREVQQWPERLAYLFDVLLKVELSRLSLKTDRGQLLPPVGSTPEAVSCKFEFVSVISVLRVKWSTGLWRRALQSVLLAQLFLAVMHKDIQDAAKWHAVQLQHCAASTCPGPSLHFSAGSEACRSGIAGDGGLHEH